MDDFNKKGRSIYISKYCAFSFEYEDKQFQEGITIMFFFAQSFPITLFL